MRLRSPSSVGGWATCCNVLRRLRNIGCWRMVFAAPVPGATANIANEKNRAPSIIMWLAFGRGDRRESSAFHLSR